MAAGLIGSHRPALKPRRRAAGGAWARAAAAEAALRAVWPGRWRRSGLLGLLGASMILPGMLAAWCEAARASGPGLDRAGDRIELRRQMLEMQQTWRALPAREPVVVSPAVATPATPLPAPAAEAAAAAPGVVRDGMTDEGPRSIRLSDAERDQLRRQLRQRYIPPATD